MSGAQQPRLLNLLLQRGDPHSPWGFTTASDLHGNVTVKQVLPGTVGAHYLSPGDAILQVEGQDASHMPQWQVDACVHLPGKSLELLVLKKPEHEDTTARAGAPSGGGTLPRAKPRSYTRLSHQMEAESERQSQSHVNGSWTQSLTRSRRQLSWEGATHLRETNPLRRQSSQISGGGSPSPGPASPAGDGVTVCPPPPPPAFPSGAAPPAPPPPPPPNFGSIPSVRLNTEIADNRNQRGSTYEPPAAIQNAMMTKDKKPFTYTPGGLDLSQIRSPRMQRRISRNANAEGVPEQPAAPKTSPLAVGQLPPSALAAMQPQLPVPVFPTAQPTQYSPPPPPPPPMQPQRQQRVVESPPAQSPPPQQPQHIQSKPTSPQQNEPGSIYVPPVQQQQQQQGRAQVGSLYIPPVQQQQQLQEQRQTSSPLSPPPLNKAPTPWMSQRPPQQQVPPWAARASEEPGTRIIPIQVEGREPPTQSNKSPPAAASNQPNTRIIPIQMEGAEPASAQSRQSQQQQQNIQQRQPLYVHNKYNPPTPTENYPAQSPGQLQQQQSWGPPGAPIQSRSFRVLQKITDTDNQNEGSQYVEYPNSSTQGVPVQQLRKLELNDDDRALMNKFKAQVDEDTFLHNESDPRYRGAAIPSRAFRMLQSMTDGGTSSDFSEVPQSGGPVARGPQLRPSNVQPATECPPQPYIPPSEQQVQEPRKYTGGCIPSRSFRMLQAMTAPENCGPGQSDL